MKVEEKMSRGEARGPSFQEIAREEFWVVAKSFFAPIYGTMLVLRQLLRVTHYMDSNLPSDMTPGEERGAPWVIPAE